ncbi:hypothetical protein Poly30_48360 [Planctomycetes bacterium Poly30]|uniref:SnoaL-like domain-containing protein n=1 Tax=Saltatorellus ferox TaxID=2528018 RepID=A0A518EYW9_9BACT|nr:hypothetical protein Poly30_48360 [Planctomycetes bacterium Poly30]
MNSQELGQIMVEFNRSGELGKLLDEHYAEDAVSVEAMDMGRGREAVGLDAIRAKHAWWEETMIMHSMEVEGPFPHGDDRFALIFESDVEVKGLGIRKKGREVALYHMRGGKIVREEFFYSMV